jgi:hypothetical protein
MTTFESMCEILSEFWAEYRDEDELKDFVAYNDLGLPLAYFINESILKISNLTFNNKLYIVQFILFILPYFYH